MKLYIGCGLTQAPQEFKEKIDAIRDALRKNCDILDFVGLTAGTPADVYNWDIHKCVSTCDLFVAIADYPALGLGYEIGVAVEHFKKPTLVLAHTDSVITRLILGVDKPNYQFRRYETTEDIKGIIEQFILEHQREK
jgi:hypothetical protein